MSAPPIHVWPVLLGDPAAWAAVLSVDEHACARRFRREADAAAYVACRGVLRTLLAAYLGRDPGALRFTYGAHEKPRLHDNACVFNVSRSNGLAVIAIASAGSLGVDVEWIRDDVDVDALAAEFLSPLDEAQLAVTSTGERTRSLFRMWVRHEARVKATGRGLVVPATDTTTKVWIKDLELGSAYAAALAAADAESRRLILYPMTRAPRP
jgi:4'-phosphopantetheinyl transferase